VQACARPISAPCNAPWARRWRAAGCWCAARSTPRRRRWWHCIQAADGLATRPGPIIAAAFPKRERMDTTLKQRLIGAVVLVALAVIFLPMLVQGPAPDSGVADVSMRVPDAPSGEYQTRELPLLAPPSDASRGPLPSPAQEPAAAAAADDAPAARPDPASAAGQWAVSFGAYASAADADAVLARLRQAGLAGFSQTATLNGSKAWRVRGGPDPDRALAEAGRRHAIRIRADANAQVIALDAGDGEGHTAAAPATPATTPAAATTATAAPAPAPTVAAAAVPERTVTRATSDPAPARSQPPVATSPAPKPA